MNPTELLKRQIAQAFQFISSTIHQSHDENQIALKALSDDARVQYTNLELLQTRLAKGETIVDKELSDARQALLTLEWATRVKRERLTAEVAGEFRRQEAQLVFVTGRGGAGFHFVTPPLLRPGVNSLPFLPAQYDTGPWPGCGRGGYFTFPTDCLDRPPSSRPPLLPLCGAPLIPTSDIL